MILKRFLSLFLCAVLLLSKEAGAKMGDAELKVAETAAGIVGRQMEQ